MAVTEAWDLELDIDIDGKSYVEVGGMEFEVPVDVFTKAIEEFISYNRDILKVDELERVELNPKEEKRTYNFPNGDKLEFENVVAIFKNTGTTSRIETVNMYGETFVHIIKNDWISIDIKTDKFTV